MTQLTSKLPPLTKWFEPYEKPTRVGVYETEHLRLSDGKVIAVGYSLWRGKDWGNVFSTVEGAAQDTHRGMQHKRWRGLTEEVKS